MTPRLAAFRTRFDELHVDAFLVTVLPHLRYLTGFSGSSGVAVVGRSTQAILTDGRYASQIRNEARGWRAFITQTDLIEEMRKRRLLTPGMRVGFDGNALLYTQFQRLKKTFPKVKFLPRVDAVERIAAVKDDREIAAIRRAVAVTDAVFTELLPLIKPGVTELDLAAEISFRQRRHGAEGDAFETIVASGERSALPHGRATSKPLRKGDLVTLDFGCVCDGYHSDMTRTVALGRPAPEARKIYGIVREAQARASEAVAAGVRASELDAVARTIIRKAGYDKSYRHSLGHGIGLQIHEAPRISVLSKAVLETGNVVTIEPGIYIPGFGGVRIEDDVVVKNGRGEVLTRSTKELVVL